MYRQAKTLMIQGTASDTGKSFIVTGLCRLLANQGIDVVPFKAWNMSLNSAITTTGAEIGFAQFLQAQAAYKTATADMQPVLLKPLGIGKCQLILQGEVVFTGPYQVIKKDYQSQMQRIIQQSLSNLISQHQFVILEGAGSPVELNRQGPDLANMYTALLNQTPVVLASSIEQGGSLAALVGTIKLFRPAERELVKGLLINKFRGDYNILEPALDFLSNYTKKPMLGVLPYFKKINLPEEDSASLKFRSKTSLNKTDKNNLIKIAVLKLPQLANFTDFKALELENHVELSYLTAQADLAGYDLIIIPGSKTTMADLNYLKSSGLAEQIKLAVAQGKMVIGICGGYQMLGQKIIDQAGTESELSEIAGLGLLPIKTEFYTNKTTQQVKAVLNPVLAESQSSFLKELSTAELSGYEIHQGQTTYLTKRTAHLFELQPIESGKSCNKIIKDGAVNTAGNCLGTYLHDLFSNDSFRSKLLTFLWQKKTKLKISSNNSYQADFKAARFSLSYQQELERNFDLLAAGLAEKLNFEIIGLKLN